MKNTVKQYVKWLLGRNCYDYRFLRLERMIMSTNQLLRRGEDKGKQYDFYVRLHELLYVMDVEGQEDAYVRIGKANDGGYVMLTPPVRGG